MLPLKISCWALTVILVQFTNAYIQQTPTSCLDHLKNGVQTNGYYSMVLDNGETITVYCDFTSEPGSAWTLVMSWAHIHKDLPAFFSAALTEDEPVNEKTANWIAYRLSKKEMTSIKSHSSHWRLTCSFDQLKVDYRDYVRGKFKDLDVTTYLGNQQCKKVEYVNIRGHVGYQKTAAFWQKSSEYILHIDSSIRACQYDATAGAVTSEDNFGCHGYVNPKFRCTSGPSATTQYWFGGYL